MCLPMPENDTSILSLLTDLAELKQEAIRLREKPHCVLCLEGETPCWFHGRAVSTNDMIGGG